MRTLFTTLFLLAAAGSATAADPSDPIPEITLDRKEPIVFEKDVQPILQEKCIYCHAGKLIEGKYDMSSHAGIMKGGKRGNVIIPGKADESIFYLFSSHKKKPIMPPKSEDPLTPQELAVLKRWINEGAKPPAVDKPKERGRVAVSLPPAIVKPVRAVAISPDKTIVAAGRGNRIDLYETKEGKPQKTLVDPAIKGEDGKPAQASHVTVVDSMEFSPDGKLLATGSFQEVTIWNVAEAKPIHKLTGFADRVCTVAFSPDGKLLATGGGAPTEDGEIKLFEVATGKPVLDLKGGHSDTVFGVSFSPDGKMLASCGADKFVKVFEVPSGKFVKSFEGHTHHVLDVGWKSDGKFLASAGADSSVKIWDFEKGEQARTVKAHNNQVTRLVFVGNNPWFVTASADQTVKMWNVDNGGNMRSFAGNKDFLYALAVSADGKLLATGGEEGLVQLYNGENAQLIKTLVPPGVELSGAPKK